MLNGIRLNNFDNGLPIQLDNELRYALSVSDSIIRKYENYIALQLNLLFGNTQTISVVGQTTTTYTIKPIKYRNIIEKINVVIRREVDNYYSYYVYDLNNLTDIQSLSAQNKYMNTILSYYSGVVGQLNANAKVKRNMIYELDYKIFDDGRIYDFWDYLSSLQVTEDTSNDMIKNIIDGFTTECIKSIKNTISKLSTSQINEYWMPFVNPDINIKGVRFSYLIEAYKKIITNISNYQLRSLQYTTGLVGPNTNSYEFEQENLFLYEIMDIADKFEVLSFTYPNIDVAQITKYFNKQIFITNMVGTPDNASALLQQTLDFYQQNVYCFYNKLFSYNVYDQDNDTYVYQDTSGIVQWNINLGHLDDSDVLNYNTSAYVLYQDVYNKLEKYNAVTTNHIVGQGVPNQLSLYDDENTDIVYLLYGSGSITLAPHYARKFYYNNTLTDILTPMIINLNDYQGIGIVIEDNMLNKTDLTALYNKIKITLEYYQETIRHIIKLLPQSYNKEIDDTNFFKLLRALAMEMAETKYDLKEVSNGVYLNDLNKLNGDYIEGDYLKEVSGDLIYNNFGSLIDLPQKSKWTNEQYRDIVTAIINVLLAGPTLTNISDAIAKFTGYKNYIYELYKEKNNYLFYDLQTINLTYKFAIMLVKDLNKFDDSAELYKDLIYLLHIIKPAQALFLIYILFEQNEMLEVNEKFSDIFNNDDIPEIYAQFNVDELTYGYSLDNVFETHINKKLPDDEQQDYDRSKLNGENYSYKKLGVKYTLEDKYAHNIAQIPLYDVYDMLAEPDYFKAAAASPIENNSGKLSNTNYILFGTGTYTRDKFQGDLMVLNKQYTENELHNIQLAVQNGMNVHIVQPSEEGEIPEELVITIDSDKTDISLTQTIQFTTNFVNVKWECLNGKINANGLYTPYMVGTDIVKCISILDNKYITKTITVH